jgi:hypothetical protein
MGIITLLPNDVFVDPTGIGSDRKDSNRSFTCRILNKTTILDNEKRRRHPFFVRLYPFGAHCIQMLGFSSGTRKGKLLGATMGL